MKEFVEDAENDHIDLSGSNLDTLQTGDMEPIVCVCARVCLPFAEHP